LDEDNRVYFSVIASESAKVLEGEFNARLDALERYAVSFRGFDSVPPDERRKMIVGAALESVFDEMEYIELDGTSLSSAEYGRGMRDNRDFFHLAKSGTRNISTSFTCDLLGGLISVFAVPVYTDGEISGVIGGVINADNIDNLMSTDALDSIAVSYVIRPSGAIALLSPNNILYASTDKLLFDQIQLNDITDDDLKALFKLNENAGDFTFTYEDETYFASFKKTGISDWIILNVVRSSDIHTVTNNVFVITMIFISSFAFLISVGIIIAGIRNWSSKKKYNEAVFELDMLKYIDVITGGPSFEKFIMNTEEAFMKSPNANYTMISMDISKFRTINDHLGHDEGDKILVNLAKVIERNINAGESYARKNADQFYILIKYNEDVDIFGRIDTIINDTYYQMGDMRITVLFGVYRVDDINMDIRHMLDRADLARRTIKKNNESSFAFFDENMLTKIREEKKIESLMEAALESNEFRVYLQPKYDLHDRETIIGAEALIRWFRDGKMIPPGGFIPIFEKNGFIMKIDRFVFEEICKQQKIWLARGYNMRVISVNMSRINLSEPNFVRDLYEICTKYNVPTKYFEIEITESVAFENLDVLTRVFNELKNYGFHISIDDFGTGYSSLNMLKNLPVDVLKIDRAFLTDTGKNERANNIISHVIQLALSLHMKTICEGIETIEQVNLLNELGCDMAQGFYFARPMPIDDYEKLLYGENLLNNMTAAVL
jgi:diguanylate cyclase (GGDEF)-like protein